MDIFTLVLLAVGLSMDAFAVSITNGITIIKYSQKQMWITAITFGLFQGIMPVIGYFLGWNFLNEIQEIDHWIALILLGYIGIKMIKDSFEKEEESEQLFSFKLLVIQAIATSIDALAVGLSFSLFQLNIFYSAQLITVVTFIFSWIGIHMGRKIGQLVKTKALLIGGVILITIGLKIFLEHMIGW